METQSCKYYHTFNLILMFYIIILPSLKHCFIITVTISLLFVFGGGGGGGARVRRAIREIPLICPQPYSSKHNINGGRGKEAMYTQLL